MTNRDPGEITINPELPRKEVADTMTLFGEDNVGTADQNQSIDWGAEWDEAGPANYSVPLYPGKILGTFSSDKQNGFDDTVTEREAWFTATVETAEQASEFGVAIGTVFEAPMRYTTVGKSSKKWFLTRLMCEALGLSKPDTVELANTLDHWPNFDEIGVPRGTQVVLDFTEYNGKINLNRIEAPGTIEGL